MSKRERWFKEKIIHKIKELEKLGKPLNSHYIKNNYGALFNSSIKKKYFGSWRNAIEKAGLDYTKILGDAKKDRIKKSIKYTKEGILEKIKQINEEEGHGNLATSRMKSTKEGARLIQAARSRFKTWKNAILEAGFDYNMINLRAKEEKWNKEKIKDRILLIYKEGGDINPSHLRKLNNSLLKAGINHFGNWRKAVESAGILYKNILKCIPYKWNKEKVIEEIKRLYELKEELNDTNISNSHSALYGAGHTWFGSWKKAIISAGFDYDKITHFKQRYWSKEKIIEEIKKLNNQGADLSDSEMSRTNGDLRGIACKYFGSWRNAIEKAGLDYNKICKQLNELGRLGNYFEKVLCKKMFEELNPRIKRNTKVIVSGCIPDFVDEDTKEWTEIKLNCHGYGVESTIKKYLSFVDKFVIIYLIGRKPKKYSGAGFIPVDSFYPYLKTNGRQDLIEEFELLKKEYSNRA